MFFTTAKTWSEQGVGKKIVQPDFFLLTKWTMSDMVKYKTKKCLQVLFSVHQNQAK